MMMTTAAALGALAKSAFRRQFTYRGANLAGMLTNLFFGALRVAVVVALFDARPGAAPDGYGLSESITFMACAQAILGWVALWGWWDLIRAIRSGDILADLQRPVDVFWSWAAQDLGRALAQIALRAVPLMLVYGLAYRLALPADAGQWALFALSMGLAWFLAFTWRFLYSLAAFWSPDATGMARLAMFGQTFLTGFLMPLAFFPEGVAAVLKALPFAGMVATPIELFVNASRGPAALAAVGAQALWAVVLYGAARLALQVGLRRVTTQGG